MRLTPVYFASARRAVTMAASRISLTTFGVETMLSKRAPDYIGGLRASICCRVPGSYYVPPSITRGINAPDGTRVFPEREKQ